MRDAANRIEEAIEGARGGFRDGLLEHEPTITDRLLGGIDWAMNGYRAKGIRWSVKTLTASGPASQEARFGADILGTLSLDLRDLRVQKGFLAQAKRLNARGRLTRVETVRLKAQCEKMLEVTAEAFVFFYESRAFSVAPALEVVSADTAGSISRGDFYTRSLASFFRDHLECFVGDRALTAPSIAVLELLRSQASARRAYLLAGVETR